uniref:peptidylprolyl isomerase n=1 Tax=Corethron hystrix TaxID=216773 RepID=A0A7S1BXJ4_9STRA|mmetsp:Transcript_43245/g.101389  ORF Transcript_43245/g.101389 Transcript_43245/m.101389 type:complete len:181 (+) Transcript_43245:105-647(+)|eukprot:CAMPEP_0113318354 /NCGR_PEP_ID=MMETSP0010_2-20120614/12953_1 /TAXON_ID=216773 ORGANISM="Corethron hystrix, Strain 308" /NCGR_SAMPLE_ID=MMETSP0010_2 /ASSEMBLY_ACC=CAM_ASM_000155 /LENGTH=180 /DNA_ID=CAMNT_0000175633 /DNA_START=53 /DNA_END=595 /DNA_ORIENTATION=+ /assembly_acc=CAM_ASM_000155
MPHNLLHSLLLPLLLACLSSAPHRVAAKQGDGTDLPPDSPIRIGVKKRPLDCPRRTTSGDSLSMHYTGSLYKDNKKFDSSYDRDEPFKFVVGSGQVIKGWDQGLLNMCVGEKRKLVIPSDLGYGNEGAGTDIPAGATLVFEVELLDISDADYSDTYDSSDDVDGIYSGFNNDDYMGMGEF